MMIPSKKSIGLVAAVLFLAPAIGCRPTGTASTSTSTEVKVSTGVVDDSAGFWVKPCTRFEASGSGKGSCTVGNHLIHKRTAISDPYTDYNQECKVTTADGTSGALIDCMVEADELELAFYGISFAYNVPSTMCEYFLLDPYHFWNFKPSSGAYSAPYDVTVNQNADGKVTPIASPTATFTSGQNTVKVSANTGIAKKQLVRGPYIPLGTYVTDFTGTTISISQNVTSSVSLDNAVTLYFGEVVSFPSGDVVPNKDGTGVSCLYDYSRFDSKLPNCCEGDYSLSVIKAGAAPETSTPNWGGKTANCLGGPAVRTATGTTNGFPNPTIYNVLGKGLNDAYVALDVNGDSIHTTVDTANYFGGLDVNDSNTYHPAVSSFAGYTPHPVYDFSCLDRDFEVKARIRLTVREWNTKAELDKYRAGTSGATPDQSGSESSGSGSDYNDLWDWDDYDLLGGFPQDTALSGKGASLMSRGVAKMLPEFLDPSPACHQTEDLEHHSCAQ